MAVDCSSMSEPMEYDIELHTVTFENAKDVVVRDCAGSEKFRCDVSQYDLCIDVVQSGSDWKVRLGRPSDMPLGSPVFTKTLDFTVAGTQVIFEKQAQYDDFVFVGTHDLRYECVAAPAAGNGYKRYAYKLSECRIKLAKDSSTLKIECQCESDPCGSNGHSGFLATIALKP